MSSYDFIRHHKTSATTRLRANTFLLQMQLQRGKVAERLLQLRGQANLTQQQVADEAGVTVRAYQRWESGEAMPYHRNLERLATIFGTTAEDVYGGPVEKREPRMDALERIESQLSQINERLAQLEGSGGLSEANAEAFKALMALAENQPRKKNAPEQ